MAGTLGFHVIPFVVFVSSTSDLRAERECAQKAVQEFYFDCSRFESWAASSNHPLGECLQQIKESHAVILLLGSKYGAVLDSGLSATHLEYRHAKEHGKPIFAHILQRNDYEPEQQLFIDEVRKCHQAPYITTDQVREAVKVSLRNFLVRSLFGGDEATPPSNPPPPTREMPGIPTSALPSDPQEAINWLKNLYEKGDDLAIRQVAGDCEGQFGQVPEIMNLVYMAEVNCGMAGEVVNLERLKRAVNFWDSTAAKAQWAGQSLLYNQGNALGVLQRQQEAIKKYRLALGEKPDHAECWKNLGNAYLDIENKFEALQCFEEALRLNPLLFEALYSLATLKRQENDPRGALAYLNRIITSNLTPDQLSWVQGWKAVSYMEQGLFPDGIAKVEEVLAHRPDWEWAWSLAGRLYSLARHEDKTWLGPAEAFWRRFLDKYPEKAEAWKELGFICWFLRKQGNVERYSILALKAFTKAVNLGFQDDGLILDRIGHLYQNKDNWTEAKNWYRQAAQKNPGAFGYCFGVSLIFLGRHEEALPWVREAAEKHQPDAKSWFQVAVCLEKLGRIDESAVAYQKAISLDSDYPEPWFNLGGLYWNEGNREQAKTTWAEAKARFPGHPLGEQVDKLLD